MPIKNEVQSIKESFQFYIQHEDVVNMMNDADVALDNRNVDSGQVFEVWLEKANGSKLYLQKLGATDKIMFKFVKMTETSSWVPFANIDVS